MKGAVPIAFSACVAYYEVKSVSIVSLLVVVLKQAGKVITPQDPRSKVGIRLGNPLAKV